MAYEVSTPVFEGPFDLLLHLVSQQQVDIHEISITAIVEGFVAQMERIDVAAMQLDTSTEFLLIAAILIELKTKRLLPRPEGVDLDDELALWEARDLLIARLLECKTFKDAARALAALAVRAAQSVPRRTGPDERFIDLAPDPIAGVTPEKLRRAFLRAVTPRPVPVVDLSHVTNIKVSVADAFEDLAHELPRVGRITFRRLTADLAERIDVVVRFLALLELYKVGMVELEQASSFGDLVVVWTGGVVEAGPESDLALAAVEAYDG